MFRKFRMPLSIIFVLLLTFGTFPTTFFSGGGVAYAANNTIISTFAGTGTSGYSGDGGAATLAKLGRPSGIVTDGNGNIYISEYMNHTIRKVSSDGTISTVAGTGGSYGYSGDGGSATSAKLSFPTGLAIDRSGNIYIADNANQCIRKVAVNGTISTIAGQYDNGRGGYSGDGGPATSAKLNAPTTVALDNAGNIYIADSGNSRIRKIDTNGIITTVAGTNTYGYSGDGNAATSAELNTPFGVTIDGSGNIYISDSNNNCIRKVTTDGIINTVAGTGPTGYGFSGDGGAATSANLKSPYGIAVDGSGNIYIADRANSAIRKVAADGIISTLAGTGDGWYSGDGGLATSAHLNYPWGVTIDNNGKIYIADYANSRIRTLGQPTASITSVSVSPVTASVAQGGTLQLTPTVSVVGGAAQTVTWTSSDTNNKVTVDANGLVTAAADATTGDYTITATSTVDNTKFSAATITITAAAAVQSVSVSPVTASVAQGGTLQLTPTVSVVGGAAQTVTWTSSDTNNKVTVDANGLVTAAADAATGNYTITATSTVDHTKFSAVTITITAAPPVAQTLTLSAVGANVKPTIFLPSIADDPIRSDNDTPQNYFIIQTESLGNVTITPNVASYDLQLPGETDFTNGKSGAFVISVVDTYATYELKIKVNGIIYGVNVIHVPSISEINTGDTILNNRYIQVHVNCLVNKENSRYIFEKPTTGSTTTKFNFYEVASMDIQEYDQDNNPIGEKSNAIYLDLPGGTWSLTNISDLGANPVPPTYDQNGVVTINANTTPGVYCLNYTVATGLTDIGTVTGQRHFVVTNNQTYGLMSVVNNLSPYTEMGLNGVSASFGAQGSVTADATGAIYFYNIPNGYTQTLTLSKTGYVTGDTPIIVGENKYLNLKLVQLPTLLNVATNVVTPNNLNARSSVNGYLYLVSKAGARANLADLNSQVTAGTGTTIAVYGYIAKGIPTTGLAAGIYVVYAVDAAGNLSLASADVTVTNPVTPTVPTVSLSGGSVETPNPLSATSSKDGFIYLVLKSGARTSKADLDTQVSAGTGTKIEALSNDAAALPTTGLLAGTYVVYAVDSAGNLSANSADVTVTNPESATHWTDITGGEVFKTPQGIAVDRFYSIYAVDSGNKKIKKLSMEGVWTDITGGEEFYSPTSIVVDKNFNLYVLDCGDELHPSKIKKLSNGVWTDITTGQVSFISPAGMTLDRLDNLYVVDSGTLDGNTRVGYKINVRSGDEWSESEISPSFSSPVGIATDRYNDIYITDSNANKIGKLSRYQWTDITGTEQFLVPWGLALDSSQNVYVMDMYNSKIKELSGSIWKDITGDVGFTSPNYITVDDLDNVYVTDANDPGKIKMLKKELPAVQTVVFELQDASGYVSGATVTIAGCTMSLTTNAEGVAEFTNLPVGAEINYTITKEGYQTIQGRISVGRDGANISQWLARSDGSTVSSSDATLSSLTLSNGTLNESFASTTTSYNANVENEVASIAVTPTVNGSHATVTVNNIAVNSGIASSDLPLSVGSNTITVKVTAHDGTTIKIYTITITRAAAAGNGGSTNNSGGTSSSGGSTSGSTGSTTTTTLTTNQTPTTIQANVVDAKTGQDVKAVAAQVTTASDGTKTVALKSQEAVVVQQADGTKSALTDISKLSFSIPTSVITDSTQTTAAASNVSVAIAADGTITVEGLANNTESKFNVTYDLGNGQHITIGTMDVKVSSTGSVDLTSTLIDPFGTITDTETGKVVNGVKVVLHFANTDRNIKNGKLVDSQVNLPEIPGFKPNNNINPQISTATGEYGWMVYPTSDYYITAVKDGYNNYVSPIISVEQEIVKFDFSIIRTNLTKPSITLVGSTESTIKMNNGYTELGAAAVDSNGVDITKRITVSGAVDVTKPGDYTITYSVKDASSNETSVTRLIHVINTAKPVLTLKGDEKVSIKQGDQFKDPGATAIDNNNKDITDKVVANNIVDTNISGDYRITYNVTDHYGNEADPVIRTVHVINTSKPVLTLKGDTKIFIKQGIKFKDPGVIAIDNNNKDITGKVIAHNTVNVNVPGDYSITYNVTDEYGNIAEPITRTVHVINTAKPILTLKGNGESSIKQGKTYKDLGAAAMDNQNRDLSNKVVVKGVVNTNVPGDYNITYNVTDEYGNVAEPVIRKVHVISTVKPILTLKGAVEITIKQGEAFKNLGVTAKDNQNRDITNKVVVKGVVNTNIPGDYSITYKVTDEYGNTAEPVTRTVHVISTAKPVLTLKGAVEITIKQGEAFKNLGVTAKDNQNRDITDKVVVKGAVDTNVPGDYNITYSVTDEYGNIAEPATRTVHVMNTAKPVLTLKGDAEISIKQDETYVDPGAVAIDNHNREITAMVVVNGVVDTKVPGEYSIAYNVTDEYGNVAEQIIRTVHVINTTKPLITLIGSKEVTVKINESYKDAGATAIDNQNNDLTDKIESSGIVNTNKAGDYLISYSVVDSFGNTAELVTRTVHVVKPTLAVQPAKRVTKLTKPAVKAQVEFKNVIIAGKMDGISGSVFAAITKSLVLTTNNVSSIKVKKSITTAYILGGNKVIEKSIEKQILGYGVKRIVRLGGVNAYETSELIIKYMKIRKGTPVLLFSNKTPLALMKAVILKNSKNYPIILTESNILNQYAKESFMRIKPSMVYIIGDAKALSTSQGKVIAGMKNKTIRIQTISDIRKIK